MFGADRTELQYRNGGERSYASWSHQPIPVAALNGRMEPVDRS